MAKFEIDSDGERLIELYSEFQRIRQLVPFLPIADYHNFFDGKYQAFSMPAVWLAEGQVMSAGNAVNRFGDYVMRLIAWNQVLRSASEDDKIDAMIEFMSPLADHCLGAPYSIKQMLIKSVCKLSYSTRAFHERGFKGKLPRNGFNFPDAQRLAGVYSTWNGLSTAFAELDTADYRKQSGDYRNQLNHGFPRDIEHGHLLDVEIESNPAGHVGFIMKDLPPLRLEALIPLLSDQHAAAHQCYNRYVDLVKEQRTFWLRKDAQP